MKLNLSVSMLDVRSWNTSGRSGTSSAFGTSPVTFSNRSGLGAGEGARTG